MNRTSIQVLFALCTVGSKNRHRNIPRQSNANKRYGNKHKIFQLERDQTFQIGAEINNQILTNPSLNSHLVDAVLACNLHGGEAVGVHSMPKTIYFSLQDWDPAKCCSQISNKFSSSSAQPTTKDDRPELRYFFGKLGDRPPLKIDSIKHPLEQVTT